MNPIKLKGITLIKTWPSLGLSTDGISLGNFFQFCRFASNFPDVSSMIWRVNNCISHYWTHILGDSHLKNFIISQLIADLNGSIDILILFANVKLYRKFEIIIAVKFLICCIKPDLFPLYNIFSLEASNPCCPTWPNWIQSVWSTVSCFKQKVQLVSKSKLIALINSLWHCDDICCHWYMLNRDMMSEHWCCHDNFIECLNIKLMIWSISYWFYWLYYVFMFILDPLKKDKCDDWLIYFVILTEYESTRYLSQSWWSIIHISCICSICMYHTSPIIPISHHHYCRLIAL